MVQYIQPRHTVRPEQPRIWTLIITGGCTFTAATQDNPLLRHDGIRTVGKLSATPEEVDWLATYIRDECKAAVEVLTEGQSPETTIERIIISGNPGPR